MGIPDKLQLPPEVSGALGAGGLAGAVLLVWRIVSEGLKLRADAGMSAQQKRTAELLGDKAQEEARKAGVETLAEIVATLRQDLKATRDDLDSTRAELHETRSELHATTSALETEKEIGAQLRSAILEFIGTVESLLPTMPDQPQGILRAALAKLRTASAWHWPLVQSSATTSGSTSSDG